MVLLLIMRHTMEENRVNGAIPYMIVVVFIAQLITLVNVIPSPDKQEFVCQGIMDNPNAVRCFEQ